MVKNNDRMKFITLFNKLQYEKPIDDAVPTDSFADYLIDDIDLKKMAPERFNYYKDLIDIFNKKPQTLYNILKKYYRFQDMTNKEKKYLNKLSFYEADKATLEVDDLHELKQKIADDEKSGDIIKNFLQTIKTDINGGGKENQHIGGDPEYKESAFRNALKKNYGMTNINYLNTNISKPTNAHGNSQEDKNTVDAKNNAMEKRYKNQNKLVEIGKEIDIYNDGEYNTGDIKKKILKFENDPENPLKELDIKFDDRIVFIFSTFFIRYVTLVLIKWCIDINIIKTFEEGFYYYAAIYLTIFWFIVLFVNIDNSTQVDYMNFDDFMNSIRSVFYYYYMGTNGITRLFVHTCLIIVLLMIPIILNIRKKNDFEEDDDNEDSEIVHYDERKKLIKSLSLFTIYIWVLTSIIATKF
jgi:hypothetical protein